MRQDVTITDLLKFLGQFKWSIFSITTICIIISTIFAFLLPPIYRSEVLMYPAESETGRSGNLSKIADQFGGLVGLGSLGGEGNSKVSIAIATINSRVFTNKFIKENKLLPILYHDQWDRKLDKWKSDNPADQPNMWDAFKKMDKKIRTIRQDKTTGFVTLSIEWYDPELAQRWATIMVKKINAVMKKEALEKSAQNIDYLTKKLTETTNKEVREAIVSIISSEMKSQMIAHGSDEYVFHIIDPAYTPEEPVKPKKPLVIFLGLITGVLLSTIYIFAVHNRIQKKIQKR